MGLEPTISCVTSRRALHAAPRGRTSFRITSNNGSGGIRTHSISRSKREWSAGCLPSRLKPFSPREKVPIGWTRVVVLSHSGPALSFVIDPHPSASTPPPSPLGEKSFRTECPGRDSNSHSLGFKPSRSACWRTRAFCATLAATSKLRGRLGGTRTHDRHFVGVLLSPLSYKTIVSANSTNHGSRGTRTHKRHEAESCFQDRALKVS